MRVAIIALASAGVSFGAEKAGNTWIALVHLVAFGIWLGTSVWTTFVSGYVLT